MPTAISQPIAKAKKNPLFKGVPFGRNSAQTQMGLASQPLQSPQQKSVPVFDLMKLAV